MKNIFGNIKSLVLLLALLLEASQYCSGTVPNIAGSWSVAITGTETVTAEGQSQSEPISATSSVNIIQAGSSVSYTISGTDPLTSQPFSVTVAGTVSGNTVTLRAPELPVIPAGFSFSTNTEVINGTIAQDGTTMDMTETGSASGTYGGYPVTVTTTATAVFTSNSLGSLQVTLAPAAAVNAGAEWQVDGGAWQNSGALAPGLSEGSHTVTFSAVSGYATPASQTVTVYAGETTQVTGTYTASVDTFNGVVAGTNLKLSPWFGYYTYGAYPFVYEYNLGYEYAFPAGNGVYLYDYTCGHFWYTQSTYFPFLYDFSLETYLYYYGGNGNPRYFLDCNTNKVISE